jgi:hypothetical protein
MNSHLIRKAGLAALLCLIPVTFSDQKAFGASLSFLGIVDNGIDDIDPVVGRIELINFLLAPGVTFNGSATETSTPTSVIIKISPFTITNTTDQNKIFANTVSSSYSFTPDEGKGRLFAFIRNVKVNGAGDAGLSVLATATSFDNNSALASQQIIGPGVLNDFDEKVGFYSGDGDLVLNFDGNLSPGQSFTTKNSVVSVASVPEPSSILGTLVFGAFGMSAMLKRKLMHGKLAK